MSAAVHDHIVNVYDEDDHIVEDVTDYLLHAIRRGGAGVAIATAAHLEAIGDGLQAGGIDPRAASRDGRYVALDATRTLSRCMANGAVDATAFTATIEPVIAGASRHGRSVRAFGEMVSLLWEADDAPGAVTLESLWNDLAGRRPFSLCCGYSVDALGSHGPLSAVGRMCAQHSATVMPRGYERPRASRGPGLPHDVCSRVFLPVLTAIRSVRRFVNDALTGWGWESHAGEAALVASELATNAVMHTSGPFRVALEVRDHVVTIRVEDTSPILPQRMAPTAATEGGRGLVLVEELSWRSGADAQSDGKTVWAAFARAAIA